MMCRLQELAKEAVPQAGTAPFAAGVIKTAQVRPGLVPMVEASKEIPDPVVEVPKNRVSVVLVVLPAGTTLPVGQAIVVLGQ